MVSLFVGLLVEAEGPDAGGPVRDNRLGATIFQPLSELCTVVGGVAEKLGRRLSPADQSLGRWTVVRLAATQEEG